MIFRMYTYPEIKAIAINELRDFAKEIGVKSPTTMPKEALDLAVMARLKEMSESRAPSTLMEVRSRAVILNKMRVSDDDRVALSGYKDVNKKGDFALYNGYFRAYEDGDGIAGASFLPCDKDVFIEQSFVERAQIMQGDYITGNAFYNVEADMFMAVSVDTVNAKTITQSRAPDIRTLKRLDPFVAMPKSDGNPLVKAVDAVCGLKLGQRILLSHGHGVDLTKVLYDWAKSLLGKDYKKIVLPVFLAALPEKEDLLTSIPNSCVSTFDVPAKYNDCALELLCEASMRYAEEGGDVIVFVNNIEACQGDSAVNHLMGAACNTQAGSVTVIASVNGDIMPYGLYNRLIGYASGFVRYENVGDAVGVDFTASWTKNDDFNDINGSEVFMRLKEFCGKNGIKAAMAELETL